MDVSVTEAFGRADDGRLDGATLATPDLLHRQLTLAQRFAATYPELPFGDGRRAGTRYWLANRWFGHGDGVVLYSMLRYLQPRRFMSIGSGPSSACALDTAARFVPRMVMRFFEPRPEQLDRMLRTTDRARVIVMAPGSYRVEDFADLEPGDVLFVDPSAITRYGSEVIELLSDLLRQLPGGVIVHLPEVPELSGLAAERCSDHDRGEDIARPGRVHDQAGGVCLVWSNRSLAAAARDEVAAVLPAWSRDPGMSTWLKHRSPRRPDSFC